MALIRDERVKQRGRTQEKFQDDDSADSNSNQGPVGSDDLHCLWDMVRKDVKEKIHHLCLSVVRNRLASEVRPSNCHFLRLSGRQIYKINRIKHTKAFQLDNFYIWKRLICQCIGFLYGDLKWLQKNLC